MPRATPRKAVRGRLSKAHGWGFGNGRTHRGKTVTRLHLLMQLELPLSEKQIPQVVEKLESGGKRKEALERARVRVEQEVRPPVVSAIVLSLLRIRALAKNRSLNIAALSHGGGQSRVPACHAGRQSFKPTPY